MSNIWARFDDIAKPEEVMEIKSSFTPIEEGEYDVVLEELAPSESRNGLPMLKGKFRIKENNRILFYNQLLQNMNSEWATAKNIAEAVDFVSGLLGEEIEFTGLIALAELIETIPLGLECRVEVSYGANDLEKKFTQLKVVVPEDVTKDEWEDDSDLPFN